MTLGGRRARSRLPWPVWLLGWISLVTDLASEAIYPLLPAFLSAVLGAGAAAIGLIEGIAEATASLLKVVSGRLSDRWQVRKPIVVAGYSLSSAVRPLMALATIWPHVLVLRFVDRVGKGVRGAPRDAMLAHLSTPETRGRVFGVSRMMDHAGAVAGPMLASVFLYFHPGEYRTLFALTLLPGLLVVALVLRVPETSPAGGLAGSDPRSGTTAPGAPATEPVLSTSWGALPPAFYRLQAVILLFTLGNSTDAFLLLRLGDAGIPAALIPALWGALHVVKASVAMPGGALSDRVGRRVVIAAGWFVYALVYAGFALETAPWALVLLFLGYGLYFGLAESAERALVADLAPRALGGTAFGVYNAVVGFGSLLASIVFGVLWTEFGAPTAFFTGAALALAASVALFLTGPGRPGRGEQRPGQ
jgi:MFS family permease